MYVYIYIYIYNYISYAPYGALCSTVRSLDISLFLRELANQQRAPNEAEEINKNMYMSSIYIYIIAFCSIFCSVILISFTRLNSNVFG